MLSESLITVFSAISTSIVLYIKIFTKVYANLTKMIIAVRFATSPRHPHTVLATFSAMRLFFPFSHLAGAGRTAVLVPSICALTSCSLGRSECDLGHLAAWCIIHKPPLLSGQLFSIWIPDVVQSVLHSLSWLLAIDHKQGTRVLNKRRGFML